MKRSISLSSLSTTKLSSPQSLGDIEGGKTVLLPPGSGIQSKGKTFHRRHSSSSSAGWWDRQYHGQGRTRGEQWARVILILCILGGCLIFTGEQPEADVIRSIQIMSLSEDGCAEGLGFPKIALLFLLKGALYHARTWERWLEGASGMVPIEHACPRQKKNGTLGVGMDDGLLLEECMVGQHVYNVYVHLSAELDIVDVLDDTWRQYAENVTRVVTKWGHHSLVEATRNLLMAAFKDPANQRFMLLSESHIPIWDALTVYRLNMNEQRSYINSWWHDDMNENRWTRKMEPVVPLHHWRKSQQWFSLIRSHVSIILQDKKVYKAFHDHCVYEWDFDNMKHRKCFSDEHYFATLLSIQGLEGETVPFYATNTMVDWSEGGAHPRSFRAEDVSADRIKDRLRSHHDCPITREEQKSTQTRAKDSFLLFHEKLNLQDMCRQAKDHKGNATHVKLPAGCACFARKFEQDTTDAIFWLLSDCDLNIFAC